MTAVTATEFQNNFGKYLQQVISCNEVIILKNGKEVARLISKDASVSFLSDSLVGVLNKEYDEEAMKRERLSKYENID